MTGRLAWAAASLLAVGVAAVVSWPAPDTGPVRPAPLPQAEAGSAVSEPSGSEVAAVLARPLFTPGRRPETPEAASPLAAPGRPELPRLTGILVTPAGRRAIFVALEGGHATVVTEGSAVGPWRVEAIRSAEVQLAGPDGRRTVRPSYSQTPALAVGSCRWRLRRIRDRSACLRPTRLPYSPTRRFAGGQDTAMTPAAARHAAFGGADGVRTA